MKSFKEFLKEETSYPWQIKTNEELRALPNWEYRAGKYSYKQDDKNLIELIGHMVDGEFEILGQNPGLCNEMLVQHGNGFYIPFKIKEWKTGTFQNGDLRLINLNLTSFIGIPDNIYGSLIIKACPNLTVESCPKNINNLIWIDNLPFTNNIDKVFTSMKRLTLSSEYKGYMSILKLKGLKHIEAWIEASNNPNKPMEQAISIVSKFLGTKDYLECQEELIEAGLKEFAKF